MEYEPVIGLEVHAQLMTQSKMFCRCSADYANASPDSHVCPVCLGMPGVLPTINGRAIEYTVMTALALDCEIPPFSKFDRKNYPYPDLMKGYQISQYDQPLSRNGRMEIVVNGSKKVVRINRVHLEEDTAKLLHRTDSAGNTYSLVDVNRSGVPLMEIVGEPDLRSPEEAKAYLQQLRHILRWIGASTGNMEEGSLRCDANISVRPKGSETLGSKVEIKNMNSFRSVERALRYEIVRQIALAERGEPIPQETRGWVDDREVTVSQRSKEFAHDYRYFPEPDLPPIMLSREYVEEISGKLPELPTARAQRFVSEYGLPEYDAMILTESRPMADFFEGAVGLAGGRRSAKAVSNWLMGETRRYLAQQNLEIADSKITPAGIAEIVKLIEQKTITETIGKQVFEIHARTGDRPESIVHEQGLTVIADQDSLAPVVDQVLRDHPQAIADFRAGKSTAVTFLIGQVMRATRGKANATLVSEILRSRLDDRSD